MLPGQLVDVSDTLLASVCNEHWSESQTLDFKRSLPGTDDKSKEEFSKDVCAFTNASGGDLVYGIDDRNGSAGRIFPISSASDPIDATKRRLLQVLESNLEPPVDVAMRSVPLAGGDYVLIVRVPASFQRPHRYRAKSLTRWVVRVDTHTVDLTYEQIRNAFDRTATLVDRARRFRDERVAAILSGTTGRPLRAGPRCVVHLIPLAPFAGKSPISVGDLYSGPYQLFMFPDWGGASRSLNLDGLVVYPGDRVADIAFTQIFRNGAMEAARWVGALHAEDARDRKIIPSGAASGFIRDAITKFLAATAKWNIAGPAVASVTVLDVTGWRFFYQPRGYFTQRNPSDRPNLNLPDIWIEQLTAVKTPDELARPLLDTLWQCFDLERCEFYDAAGRFAQH